MAARLERDLGATLGEAVALGRSIAAFLDARRAVLAAETSAQYDDESRASRERRDARLAAIEVEASERATVLRSSIEASIADLAPGAASASWTDPWTAAPHAGMFLRVGTGPIPGSAALAPFLDTPGWWLEGNSDATAELMGSTLARLVASLPPRSLDVIVFDPRLRGVTGPFGRLRGAGGFRPVFSSSADFLAALEDAVRIAASNSEALAASGAPDLATLRAEDPTSTVPAVVVVAVDYPQGIGVDTQAALLRLADTAGPRGVSLIVQAGRDRATAEVKPDQLRDRLEVIRVERDAVTAAHFPEGTLVSPDGGMPRELLDQVVVGALERASSANAPAFLLKDVLPPNTGESSESELIATVGRRGRLPVSLSFRSENPPLPNLLVGGAVGQGKSNLLLDIIYSLALRYPPEELEFLLLDFKLGLEFMRFDADDAGINWLPHARALSLESNRDFGLAVLDYVVGELGRRSEEFKRVRANDIGSYRRASGMPMPRLVLVIDEFHVMFDGEDDLTDVAVTRLEQLAKQGRAFGIHLVLSSQTVSGISGFRIKGDGIFAQFPTRISLKNTVDESQALFTRGNVAASELSFRGEFIINRNLGLDPENSNERGIAAYAEPGYLEELQAELWAAARPTRRPLVFLGRDFATWPARPPAGDARSPELWIGRPIEITDEPVVVRLRDDVDQGVALVGTGPAVAGAVLASIAATAVAQAPAGSRVIVLDGGSDRAEGLAWLDEFDRTTRASGHTVTVVPRDEVSAHLLTEIGPALAGTGPGAIVIGIELQRVADLTGSADEASDAWGVDTAAAVLVKLGSRGALAGWTFVGWWTTLRAISDALGFEHNGIGTYLVLSLSSSDRRTLGVLDGIDGDPRVCVVARGSGDPARVAVPFEPIRAGTLNGWRS